MDWKKQIEEERRRRERDVTRAAVLEALRHGVPDQLTVRELIAELRDDERLWAEFESLRLEELRELFATKSAPGNYGPPGPDRRHGVTAERILGFVRDHQGCRLGDISAALGLQRGAVTSQLRNLRREGRLTVRGIERRFSYYAD